MQLGECDMNDVLWNRKKKKKNYSENEIFYIIQHLVKGLLELKFKGIAHRDVKPQNFILTQEKNGYAFKITDFGSSYYSKSFEDSNRIPWNTIIAYTPFYADPRVIAYFLIEKYEKKKFIFKKAITYDPFSCDIFSLGITILSMMGLKNGEIKKIRENLDNYQFKQKYKDNYSGLCFLVPKMLQKFNRIRLEDLIEELRKNPQKTPDESEFLEKSQKVRAKKKMNAKFSKVKDNIIDEINVDEYLHFIERTQKAIKEQNKEIDAYNLDCLGYLKETIISEHFIENKKYY